MSTGTAAAFRASRPRLPRPKGKEHNLVLKYLEDTNQDLEFFDGDCRYLAVCAAQHYKRLKLEVVEIIPAKDLYLYPVGHWSDWKYHAVLAHGSLIHDAWFGAPAVVEEYVQEMFPNQDVFVISGQKVAQYFYKRGKFSYK